jgi:hypothetical protein
MEIAQKIEKMRAEHLKKIEDAARTGDASKILAHSKVIEKIERLREEYSGITNSVIALEQGESDAMEMGGIAGVTTPRHVGVIRPRPQTTYKEQGKRRRLAFIQTAASMGIRISPLRGVKYRVGKALICIATAFENLPNRWFMGLPPDDYSALVLLCEAARGDIVRFILDRELLSQFLEHLGKDQNGQLKLNIYKEGQSYFLKATGLEKICIDSFADKFESLRLG